MMLNKKNNKNFKANHSTTGSYIGFVFQTVLKRPFGYIAAILFIIYLATIFLIVPKVAKLNPLFIWSNASFNMPIFNLMFMAAVTSSLAVCVFKTGTEDGTDLTLSAKPITKRARILSKLLVYFIVMLIMCLLITGIISLIKPVFGEFSIFNINGITNESYRTLMVSMLIGNLISMLLFGGIAVLISMVGGQVVTLIGTIGCSFILCLLNVLFPMVVSSPRTILNDRYNCSINSITAFTRNQFNNPNGSHDPSTFASIDCKTKEDGTIVSNFDTYEYWTKANKESGLKVTNYFDIGKQLSNIYTSSREETDDRLASAKRKAIGTSSSFNYTINKDSKVSNKNNIDKQNYPISIYTLMGEQGYVYPVVQILGEVLKPIGGWDQTTNTEGFGWNSCALASTHWQNEHTTIIIKTLLNNKPWLSMSEIKLNESEIRQAKIMFEKIIVTSPNSYRFSCSTSNSAIGVIINNNENIFWQGGKEEFLKLSYQERFNIVGRILVAWAYFSQQWQIDRINEYCAGRDINDSFPFTSKTFISWYYDMVIGKDKTIKKYFNQSTQIGNIFASGVCLTGEGELEDGTYIFCKLPRASFSYCETYKNLYKYDVYKFYNSSTLMIVWTILSIGLFTTSVIVYRKTDLK